MVASAYLPCWRYRFPLSKNFFFSVLASREHPVVRTKQMARRMVVICWHRVFIQIPFRGRQTLRRASWLSRNARSVTEVGEHMAAIKDNYGLISPEITKEVERLEPKRLRAAPGLETPAHLV